MAPSELEGHLLDHPDVSDVCVVGIPDDYSGELPFAFVVPSAGAVQRAKASLAEAEGIKQAVLKVRTLCVHEKELLQIVVQHVSDHKVRYKWLAGIEFVESIPKNPSGKLLRRELRDRAKGMLEQGKLALMNLQEKPRARL